MANNRRAAHPGIWAVIPIKETVLAKQRLAAELSPHLRQELALAMFEDVLTAVAAVPEFSGIAVVTIDPDAAEIARRWGAEVWTDGAREGHTGAVSAAAGRLAAMSSAMLTIPGDVPLVTPADIERVLAAHLPVPAFTIVPAWDERGSNTVVCSPADLVPLRFGSDSFFPHLAAARAQGVTPTVVRNDAIALDFDEPSDLIRLYKRCSTSRTLALLHKYRAEWSRESVAALETQ